jgi:hypothetical protein
MVYNKRDDFCETAPPPCPPPDGRGHVIISSATSLQKNNDFKLTKGVK